MTMERPAALRSLRRQLHEIRQEVFRRFPEELDWLQQWSSTDRTLGWVLGGPRSGTSAFKATLARHGQVLSLPGEHRCYFTLLGRNHPDHGTQAEADDTRPLDAGERRELLEMILTSAFTGEPLAAPSDRELHRYAWEWALRLPMQWPHLRLDPLLVVQHIELGVRRFLHGGGQLPSPAFDVAVLRLLQQLSPHISPRAYDLPAGLMEKHFAEVPPLSNVPSPLIVEITPYVVLQPRPLKVDPSLARVLLLKASSDPFRLRTMQDLFAGWDRRILQLTRNPLAAVNGLLDGWAFPGFWQHQLPADIGLPPERQAWKFDLVDGWPTLARGSLVALAAEQWRVPSERILGHLAEGTPHTRLAFEAFLQGEVPRSQMLSRALAALDLETDDAARGAMKQPPAVNVTQAPRAGRWRERAGQLEPLLQAPRLCATAMRMGYQPTDTSGWI